MKLENVISFRTIILVMVLGSLGLGFFDANFRDKHLKEIILTMSAGAYALMTPRNPQQNREDNN